MTDNFFSIGQSVDTENIRGEIKGMMYKIQIILLEKKVKVKMSI